MIGVELTDTIYLLKCRVMCGVGIVLYAHHNIPLLFDFLGLFLEIWHVSELLKRQNIPTYLSECPKKCEDRPSWQLRGNYFVLPEGANLAYLVPLSKTEKSSGSDHFFRGTPDLFLKINK